MLFKACVSLQPLEEGKYKMNISFEVVVKLMSLLLLIINIGMHANNKDIGDVQQDTLE